MNRKQNWTILAAMAMAGILMAAPTAATAQTKSKKSQSKSSTRKATKSRAAKPKKPTPTKSVAKKWVAPKSGVMNTGAFRPLRNDDRITVVLPRRPAAKSNMSSASTRRTVFTTRSLTPSANTVRMVTQSTYPSTALIINNPNSNWWGYNGPPSTSIYDARYGWITNVAYPWGNVLYTYGYQVVNYWDGNDYVWYSYPGVTGVAYPVLYR